MHTKREKIKMNYQICNTCIMDTSDSKISFNSIGICEYCENYSQKILPNWEQQLRHGQLSQLADVIKTRSKGGEYDCIIGLSGGLDSSYATHIAVKVMGLNPLLVHVDAGWNTTKRLVI